MQAIHSYILLKAMSILALFVLALLCCCTHYFYFLYFGIEVRVIGSTDDILPCGIFAVILDIICYGIVKEDRLLTDHTQRAPQVVHVVILYVYAVNQNLSFIYIIKSLQ